MDDTFAFPDGRSFSEFVGQPSVIGVEQLDDPDRYEGLPDLEGYGFQEEWSVCDSEVNRELKRAMTDEDEPQESMKRLAVSNFTPRVVGESSGAVFDAIASSSKSPIPLQSWEQGVFALICGGTDLFSLPTIPKLEQPAEFAPPPQTDGVDAAIIAIDKDPVFTHAVKLRARWGR